MNNLLILLQKEFRQIFRNPTILRMILAMPIIQLILIPFAADYEIKNISVSVVDLDHSDYSRRLVEKMAAISKRALQEGGYEKGTPIVVVGGASNFEEFTKTFSQYIGLPVDKPLYPEFVTPLGIAMGSEH